MKLTSARFKLLITLILLALLINAASYFNNKPSQLPKMTVQQKKARFTNLIVPAVNSVYASLMKQYLDIETKIQAGTHNSQIAQLKKEYKVETNEQLLMALKPHPKSIAIAQAAMESSWATSRFFREAYNIFGVWSFNKNEPRIAAAQKRGDKTIWLKKYASIEASIYDYYLTLARSSAFDQFRQTKMQTNDPFVLVTKLDSYSEKGHLYGEELTSIIKYNKFYNYDSK